MITSRLMCSGAATVAFDAPRRARRAAMLCVALCLGASGAHATPLDLTPVGPDFFISQVAYTYTYSNNVGTLLVTGAGDKYTDVEHFHGDGVTRFVFGPPPPQSSFQLTATLLPSACPGPGCVTGGSFRIFSDVNNDVAPFPLVYDGYVPGNEGVYALGGDLPKFGWSGTGSASGLFEFVYENASGVIPKSLGLVNADGGIILSVKNASGISNFQN